MSIPIDILPVFKSPAVQVLTFYGGMPAASIEKDITNRMERWTGQAAGTARQESRSIVGASIVRNYYRERHRSQRRADAGQFAGLGRHSQPAARHLAAGHPAVRPDQHDAGLPRRPRQRRTQTEAILYDTGRYEVRNMIMAYAGAVAPVVYGGKLRAVLAYLDRGKLQARNLSPRRRDERHRQLQHLPAHRRRQVRQHRLRPRLQLDVRAGRAHGRHPAANRARQRDLPARRGHAQGRQLDPDQRRSRQRPAAGLHSRLSASSGSSTLDVVNDLKAVARRHEEQADRGPTST